MTSRGVSVRDVYIAGIGMTDFGRFPGRGLKHMAAQAVSECLDDAGAHASDLQAAFVGNAVAGLITGQEMIRGQVMLRPLGISDIPVFNVENACASASSAFHLAWRAVAGGTEDIVLALGAEKLVHNDKQVSFDAIGTAIDLEARQEMVEAMGSTDSNGQRSLFMDIYADMTKGFMERTGASREDFARVAVKAHHHASMNARAQFRNQVTVDEVLGSRSIAGPLTLLMCSPIGDGAAATILASDDGLARLVDGANRPRVKVLASVVRSGSDAAEGTPKSAVATARAAYEMAAVGPEDLDCVELHDASAPAELMIYEDIGLCSPGQSPQLIRDNATSLGGPLPVNTSGGLLCKGHPIGATGIAQIVEITAQLRGTVGERQVDGARIGLTQNGGGWLEGDSAAMSVHVLGRAT